jgi:hypothetical protein
MESLSDATQIHPGRIAETTSAVMEGSGNMESACSIEKYGDITEGQSPKDTTSTISTEIRSTIPLRILNCCQEKNIFPFTQRKNGKMKNIGRKGKPSWRRFDQWQQSGMVARTGWHGIVSMGSEWQSEKLKSKRLKLSASNVGNITLSCLANKTKRGSALISAMPNTGETAGLMTKQESVPYVAKSFESTDSRSNKLVAMSAECVRLSWCDQRADVYNLTVEGEHEYFANGILVSNCDALAYACLSRPWTPMVMETAKPKRDRYRKKKTKQSGWTY